MAYFKVWWPLILGYLAFQLTSTKDLKEEAKMCLQVFMIPTAVGAGSRACVPGSNRKNKFMSQATSVEKSPFQLLQQLRPQCDTTDFPKCWEPYIMEPVAPPPKW